MIVGSVSNRHGEDRTTANAIVTATAAAINAPLMVLRILHPQLFLLFRSLLLPLQSSMASNLMVTNQSSSMKFRRRNI